jgi:hypothetical protein
MRPQTHPLFSIIILKPPIHLPSLIAQSCTRSLRSLLSSLLCSSCSFVPPHRRFPYTPMVLECIPKPHQPGHPPVPSSPGICSHPSPVLYRTLSPIVRLKLSDSGLTPRPPPIRQSPRPTGSSATVHSHSRRFFTLSIVVLSGARRTRPVGWSRSESPPCVRRRIRINASSSTP